MHLIILTYYFWFSNYNFCNRCKHRWTSSIGIDSISAKRLHRVSLQPCGKRLKYVAYTRGAHYVMHRTENSQMKSHRPVSSSSSLTYSSHTYNHPSVQQILKSKQDIRDRIQHAWKVDLTAHCSAVSSWKTRLLHSSLFLAKPGRTPTLGLYPPDIVYSLTDF